ncbi:unnamed protein product [Coregonus sp. 'balchen']|nr:unnamed protein product [Coregonus sp. 'balchen']
MMTVTLSLEQEVPGELQNEFERPEEDEEKRRRRKEDFSGKGRHLSRSQSLRSVDSRKRDGGGGDVDKTRGGGGGQQAPQTVDQAASGEEWSSWSVCSATCGEGWQSRTRFCVSSSYSTQCSGPLREQRPCNNSAVCPAALIAVHGAWDEWSPWSLCSSTCGRGYRDRTRSCKPPQFGGDPCMGPEKQTKFCNIAVCPVDGVWNEWANWGTCSASCSNGTMQRIRECNGPSYGGSECRGEHVAGGANRDRGFAMGPSLGVKIVLGIVRRCDAAMRREPHEICAEENFSNVVWKMTPAGDTAAVRCPPNANGLILRRCTLDDEGIAYWENPTYMKCISNDYRSIQTLTREHLSKAQRGLVGDGVSEVMTKLRVTSSDGTSYSGDLLAIVDVLKNMTEIFRRAYNSPSQCRHEISNLLMEENRERWEEAQLVSWQARNSTVLNSKVVSVTIKPTPGSLSTPVEVQFSHLYNLLAARIVVCQGLQSRACRLIQNQMRVYIRSERSVILINFCLSIISSNALILIGQTQTRNKVICTLVAAFLHFFFLSSFCWVLTEAWQSYMAVTGRLRNRIIRKRFLCLGWGLPALVVAISVGFTKAKGYGTVNYCWLSLEGGLLYAFVGPAAAVVLVNMVIGILVFNKLVSKDGITDMKLKERAGASLWSSCVVLPLLALTWMSAVLAITDRRSSLFQILFAVFDSLEGFVIVMVHCILRREVQEAVKCRVVDRQEDGNGDSGGSFQNGHAQLMGALILNHHAFPQKGPKGPPPGMEKGGATKGISTELPGAKSIYICDGELFKQLDGELSPQGTGEAGGPEGTGTGPGQGYIILPNNNNTGTLGRPGKGSKEDTTAKYNISMEQQMPQTRLIHLASSVGVEGVPGFALKSLPSDLRRKSRYAELDFEDKQQTPSKRAWEGIRKTHSPPSWMRKDLEPLAASPLELQNVEWEKASATIPLVGQEIMDLQTEVETDRERDREQPTSSPSPALRHTGIFPSHSSTSQSHSGNQRPTINDPTKRAGVEREREERERREREREEREREREREREISK